MSLAPRSEAELQQRQRSGTLRVLAAADFRALVAAGGLEAAYAATDVVVAANAEFTDQATLQLSLGPVDPPLRIRGARLDGVLAQGAGGTAGLCLSIGGGLGEPLRRGAPRCWKPCWPARRWNSRSRARPPPPTRAGSTGAGCRWSAWVVLACCCTAPSLKTGWWR